VRHLTVRDPTSPAALASCVALLLLATACGTDTDGSDAPPVTLESTLGAFSAEAGPGEGGGRRRADPLAGRPDEFMTPLVTDAQCERGDPDPGELAAALIPVVIGMTQAYTWAFSAPAPYDQECLGQVASIGPGGLTLASSCPAGPANTEERGRTVICDSDLREGRAYRTEFGAGMAETVAGATTTMLSRRVFRELRDSGTSWHRYWERALDLQGELRVERRDSMEVVVNDRVVRLPVLIATADLYERFSRGRPLPLRLAVLDDERAPLMLDYRIDGLGFGIRINKITYPARAELERELADEGRATVYGIYFAYNSDDLRAESDAVLAEIGAVMTRNAGWSLAIEGHTDGIGSDVFNQELSERRAAAVLRALVDRYGVAETRLTTSGHGASRPRDTNEHADGRARNRRVELVRR
jgi:outer membrane protein OmpA-like peptidoglycan-associated protein